MEYPVFEVYELNERLSHLFSDKIKKELRKSRQTIEKVKESSLPDNTVEDLERMVNDLEEKKEKALDSELPVKRFSSWNKLCEWLDENQDKNLHWREVGDNINEIVICNDCEATVKTNSKERAKQMKEAHLC